MCGDGRAQRSGGIHRSAREVARGQDADDNGESDRDRRQVAVARLGLINEIHEERHDKHERGNDLDAYGLDLRDARVHGIAAEVKLSVHRLGRQRCKARPEVLLAASRSQRPRTFQEKSSTYGPQALADNVEHTSPNLDLLCHSKRDRDGRVEVSAGDIGSRVAHDHNAETKLRHR